MLLSKFSLLPLSLCFRNTIRVTTLCELPLLLCRTLRIFFRIKNDFTAHLASHSTMSPNCGILNELLPILYLSRALKEVFPVTPSYFSHTVMSCYIVIRAPRASVCINCPHMQHTQPSDNTVTMLTG